MKKLGILAVLVIGIVVGVGIFALNTDISNKKAQANTKNVMLVEQSDDNPDFAIWGKNFPSHLDDFLKTRDEFHTPTEFGGSLPYSKLIRYPALTSLWGGYAFAFDFNEERGHFYSQIDQMETKRNDKEFLNAHGLKAFKGQPGTCMNCHSGWMPNLYKTIGFDKINATPYFTLIDELKKQHGDTIHGAKMGGTCADCHAPDDMSLRVTRVAFINAMVDRGFVKDEKHGLQASRNEMRGFVCQQCHDEYYFRGAGNTLVYPWKFWKKGEPFRIEMLDKYYDEVRQAGIFMQDWIHKDTKAPMIKIQHPETELSSSGIHARSGVSCADCHMPYKSSGATKITDHFIRSPLENINASCKACHAQSEKVLLERVKVIQRSTASSLRDAESALLDLIADTKKARELLGKHKDFASLDSKAKEDRLQEVLEEVLNNHRKASLRWDFIFSENSTGFHSPQESTRVLAQSIDLSRQGQAILQGVLTQYGLGFTPSKDTKLPDAPKVIKAHKPPVGALPPKEVLEADRKVSEVEF